MVDFSGVYIGFIAMAHKSLRNL